MSSYDHRVRHFFATIFAWLAHYIHPGNGSILHLKISLQSVCDKLVPFRSHDRLSSTITDSKSIKKQLLKSKNDYEEDGDHLSWWTTYNGFLTAKCSTSSRVPLISNLSIQVEDTIFSLDRVPLEEHSKLFKRLSMEPSKHNIKLKGISVEVFCHILRWIYSREVHLNEFNVFKIFDGANRLEIDDLVCNCQTFMDELIETRREHSRLR